MFERPKDVFDGSPAHFHGIGLSIKSLLYIVHHILVLPAPDATVLARRALIPLRTTRASTRPVNVDLEASLIGGEAMNCSLPRWTLVFVISSDVDEVGLVVATRSLRV